MSKGVEVEKFVACLGTNETTSLLLGIWHRDGVAGSSGKEVREFRVMNARLWGPDLQVVGARSECALMCVLPLPWNDYTAENPCLLGLYLGAPGDRRAAARPFSFSQKA